MSWSYRKNLIGKVRIYYSSGCVGPVQIPLDELADELNDYEAHIADLEEENDRLQDAWFKDETICPDGSLKPKVITLLSRIAELESQLEEHEVMKNRVAELEADNNRLKCSNDTQTQTIVYGKDSKQIPCPFCGEIMRSVRDE